MSKENKVVGPRGEVMPADEYQAGIKAAEILTGNARQEYVDGRTEPLRPRDMTKEELDKRYPLDD